MRSRLLNSSIVAVAMAVVMPFAVSAQILPLGNADAGLQVQGQAQGQVQVQVQGQGQDNGQGHSGDKGHKRARRAWRGTVTAVAGAVVSFTDAKGTAYTVDTTAGVKLVRRFGAAMKVSDIQVGDTVVVNGTLGTNGAITATVLRDLSLQARSGTFYGSVTALSGSSFTLQSKERGSQTINTDASTKFFKGKAPAALSDLAVGQNVIVSGVWDRTNSNVTATTVRIVVRTVVVRGTVTAVAGSTLTVTDAKNAAWTIDAGSALVLYAHGGKADLSVVQTSDSVIVIGTGVSGTDSLAATRIRDLSRVRVKASAAAQGESSGPNAGSHSGQ